MEKTLRKLIIALQLIMGALAFIGGIPLIITNGLGESVSDLNGHFDSFLIPGLALVLFIGFGNLWAVYSHWKKKASAVVVSSIFGFGILIFGIVKAYVFDHYTFLEITLIGYGIIVVALNILLAQLRLSKK